LNVFGARAVGGSVHQSQGW